MGQPPGVATGEYRLRRQGGGRTGFAHVCVEVVSAAQRQVDVGVGVRVGWGVDPDDLTSCQPDRDPHEVRAALAGAADALDALTRLGVATTGRWVGVIGLVINLVDTTPSAVHAAAYMATATAFGTADQFEIVYHNDWLCQPSRA